MLQTTKQPTGHHDNVMSAIQQDSDDRAGAVDLSASISINYITSATCQAGDQEIAHWPSRA